MDARNWIESPSYATKLGMQVAELSAEAATLVLPFLEENSNPGGALHGGVYAALSVTGAHAIAREALGIDAARFHTAAFQINYLSAAISEEVTAHSKLLRRGKEICFVETQVTSAAGKHVANANLLIRGRMGQDEVAGPVTLGDAGGANPGDMGPFVTDMVPFIKERGIKIEHMDEGYARLTMAWKDEHSDAATGGVHEGAALALLDTAGAMAGWAVTGPGPYKASTLAIQANVIAEIPKDDLIAYAKVTHHDNEMFFSDVEVVSASSGLVCVKGTTPYRIKK